ncbi:unnamed protein product [Rotaria magnacalcarata]|uniref:HAT C-terminal dimerisation domain-containing protein n=1 Tax=Rotaria magnacalcarata TaxID=392030 RepID=A0A816XVA8_9BILA|nr:unnamed protein product [Rotaria magnacalcarata]CAF4299222.1 unnamed protein product [Rotaria magnacalcarata]
MKSEVSTFFSDDINFKSFYTKVFKESESLTDKSILARYRRPPKRCQSSSDSVKFSSFEEFYRQQYMESLEIAVNMLQNRSTQKNFKLLLGKEMFQEYHKLIKLYLTIPVTTATAERTFSTLNRLKTAIRSTMTQSRLNHCLLSHIYKEKLDKIDPRQIVSKFISSNEKRQHFFGLIL